MMLASPLNGPSDTSPIAAMAMQAPGPSTQDRLIPGPSTLAGSSHALVNELNSTSAGGDVHAPVNVFNFNDLVYMDPSFLPSLISKDRPPQAFLPSPQRFAIIRALARFLSWIGGPAARQELLTQSQPASDSTPAPSPHPVTSAQRADVSPESHIGAAPQSPPSSFGMSIQEDAQPSSLHEIPPDSNSTTAPDPHLVARTDTGTLESQIGAAPQCPPSSFGQSIREDVQVSLLHEIEVQSVDWQWLRTPEVYVFRMLNAMKGLPCWEPCPQGRFAGPQGVIPGDVGTYGVADGFKKTFNIWKDEAIRETAASCGISYHAPEGGETTCAEVWEKGDAVTQGPSATTIFRSNSNKHIECFEFRCRSLTQGAILALPSPADRERLDDYTELHDHLIQHAELIYRHSNSLRRIGGDETLYIITGCIKSEDWGLAAYNSTIPSDDVIKLEQLSGSVGPESSGEPQTYFAWTEKGPSEARFGPKEKTGGKNQSLFLEGFKLDFSREFRLRMKREFYSNSTKGSGGFDPSSGSSSGSSSAFPPRSSPSHHGPPTPGSSDGNPGRRPPKGVRALQGVFIFNHSRTPLVQHLVSPCDIINEALLELANVPFALSHDDDWCALAKNQHLSPEDTNSNFPTIRIQNGELTIGKLLIAESHPIMRQESLSLCPKRLNIQRPKHIPAQHRDAGLLWRHWRLSQWPPLPGPSDTKRSTVSHMHYSLKPPSSGATPAPKAMMSSRSPYAKISNKKTPKGYPADMSRLITNNETVWGQRWFAPFDPSPRSEITTTVIDRAGDSYHVPIEDAFSGREIMPNDYTDNHHSLEAHSSSGQMHLDAVGAREGEKDSRSDATLPFSSMWDMTLQPFPHRSVDFNLEMAGTDSGTTMYESSVISGADSESTMYERDTTESPHNMYNIFKYGYGDF
ncbi:hypothetical protein DFP72DRAFT_1175819 [Ephemerocybe angulata]|uniref:Uncharacterized protein n=1 Tax=Ephemerocybe angulata TaxID=980116 RepID=A0A8H6HGT4_9AGAR|nr:hypothetical protein DFP72DRAFT_1175819 [Tulosesus angulatus]